MTGIPYWCFIISLLARVTIADEFIEDSQLLTAQHLSQLRQYMSVPEKTFRLLYRATRDGMVGKIFHRLCDKQGPTITIGRKANTQTVYGGYTARAWSGSQSVAADKNAFIFRLCGSQECTSAMYSQTVPSKAIVDFSTCGPAFGGGDLIFFNRYLNYNKELTSDGFCSRHHYNGSLDCGYRVTWEDIEVYGLAEFIEDSKLMTSIDLRKLQLYMRVPAKSVKLMYRATRDGMSGQAFHHFVNKIGSTITIGREATTGNLYGAYTSRSWKSTNGHGLDIRAFLFRLCGQGCRSRKFELKSSRRPYAVYDHSNYGPTFGFNHDLTFFAGAYSYNTTSKYFATNGQCSESDKTYDGGPVGCGSNVKWIDVETYRVEELTISEYIEDSHLLSTHQLTQLRQYIPDKKMKLLYRATVDGMSNNVFHSLCGWKGPTLSVGLEATKGTVYAGYTSRSWILSGGYASDNNAFLLRLCGPECTSRRFNQISAKRQYAVNDDSNKGPTFGDGHDLTFFAGSYSYNATSKYFATNGYCSGGDNTYDGGSVGCGTSVKWTDIEVYGVEESIENSPLLSSQQVSQIRQYLPNKEFKLLYRATGDGMSGTTFHQLCDFKGPTISIGREATTHTVYGGYASRFWESSGGGTYKEDRNAFLFRVCESTCTSKRFNLMPILSDFALYFRTNYGPTFGGNRGLMFFYGSYSFNTASKYFASNGYCFDKDLTYIGGPLGCGFYVKWTDVEVYAVNENPYN